MSSRVEAEEPDQVAPAGAEERVARGACDPTRRSRPAGPIAQEFELRLGEQLRAGEVRIMVRAIRGAELRLAIDAPRELLIVRGELLGRSRRPSRGEAP